MADDKFEDRLQQIWQQGHRTMAAAFLRRAMTPDTTLADVARALQFDAVRDFLGSLRLGDVLREDGAEEAEAPPAPPLSLPAPAAAAVAERDAPPPPAKRRRRRRGPEEVAELKDELRAMLRDEPGSLDTTQMYESLGQKGHELDRLTLNRLLAQLEEEGEVVCLGGRPKSWRRAPTAGPAAAVAADAKDDAAEDDEANAGAPAAEVERAGD